MRFRPRHYVLIAIILALGIYNLVRSRRATHLTSPANVTVTPSGPIPQSSAWQAFDNAASLRDAAGTQFEPALEELNRQISSASSGQKADLNGCQTWLLFYRQNIHAPATDAWKQRSTQHLSTCVSEHRDISQ